MLADRPRRLVAVHLWHHDVHQDDVDLRRRTQDVERLAAVLGPNHVHVPALQHAGQSEDVAHVVVDDQDLLASDALVGLPDLLHRLLDGRAQVLLDPVQEQ